MVELWSRTIWKNEEIKDKDCAHQWASWSGALWSNEIGREKCPEAHTGECHHCAVMMCFVCPKCDSVKTYALR